MLWGMTERETLLLAEAHLRQALDKLTDNDSARHHIETAASHVGEVIESMPHPTLGRYTVVESYQADKPTWPRVQTVEEQAEYESYG